MTSPLKYTDLLNQYNNKYQNDQCNQWDNIKTPGKCNAAKEYRNEVTKFVQESIDEEQKSIEYEKKLMNDRIKNEDHKNIYPLLNYDFDYKTAIRKELNPYKLNITNEPTFTKFVDSSLKLKNYIDYMGTIAYPNDNTVPGISDIVTENKDKLNIVKLKRIEDNKLPYPSFKKDYPECLYPTTGKNASSYFINVGSCPTKIKDKNTCITRGYKWVTEKSAPSYIKNFINTYNPDDNKNIPAPDTPLPPPEPEKGSCFKPRFVYINNKAQGIFGMDGIIPSMFNEINSIRPDKLANIMAGYNLGGSGIVPCSIEEFGINEKLNVSSILLLASLLVVLYISIKK